jgi:parallel beta-helix repeat protein
LGNGISVTREAKGEIRGNIIEQTGSGIAIGHTTAPLVVNNQIRENQDGLVISEAARPVLRGNTIANNRRDGLVAISESQPDLGTDSAPGNNIFQGNGRYDVHNFTGEKLLAIGNQLKGDRVAGLVEIEFSSAAKRTASY